MYAYFKKLDYFSTECIYAPNAYRGFAREFLKELEKVRPSAIIDIIHAGEQFQLREDTKKTLLTTCTRCGYISSNKLCKACVLLEGLNKGKAKLAIGRDSEIILSEALQSTLKVDRRDLLADMNKLDF